MELIDKTPLLEMISEKQSELTAHRGGRNFLYGDDRDEYDRLERMAEMIENASVIEDVAPVVRCKDCIFHSGSREGQPNIICFQMKDDDFCSYGEKDDRGTKIGDDK